MKYLPLYYEWMKSGFTSDEGLCNSLPDDKYTSQLLSLFRPYGISYIYWGYGEENANTYDVINKFTPLRQTIILFMAAINNEL